MNLRTTTLAAAIAMGLMCGTASAQLTDSPNPNKAQNSDMRTQSGDYPYAVYPDGSRVYGGPTYVYPGATYVTPSTSDGTVWIVPSTPVMGEPIAGRRNVYVPNDFTNTPNPNKVQNNGVPTQYDTWYIYRENMYQPY